MGRRDRTRNNLKPRQKLAFPAKLPGLLRFENAMERNGMENYTTHASGSVGQEILNPDGEVIAWTVDGCWAAIIVALLNGAPPDDLENPSASSRYP
jgi:hypothetical protein